ncbi:trypsin-like serine peptidase [Gymnodinialimonas ceratoperidinii]|uniref:Trypsin-like serine protease n=1 Tax=Gymnodinialimonas ceratoperidinii TaxID=2856823 RepID=A0A8F6TUK9_9RHOB|nr:trypsin-like serine protease [Gymnodinialimonas ceratoperidinii]QXT39251.1 trypsin-like serine protease [Gymnodinialimonas ceratoperidinii]
MRHLTLAALLISAPFSPALAQDPALNSTFGILNLQAGFSNDPNSVYLLAGGHMQRSFTDAASGDVCRGYFAEAPDFRVVYDATNGDDFSITAESYDDPVLLVNGPDGRWYCNDDTFGLDSAVTFEAPQSGTYDIWVGTYGDTQGEYPGAQLGFTALAPFEPQIRRSFFGEDDRVVLDPTQAPWNMIGLVEMQSGSCTGTLIGPDVVLTGGHCLVNLGEQDNPPLTFRAGYQNGSAVATSRVTGYHVPQMWRVAEQEGMDFGFFFLEQPLGEQLGWMEIGTLSQAELSAFANGNGPEILQAGYSADQPEVLTGNLSCPFVQLGPQNTLQHECDTVQGDSGSPLFVEDGDGYRIIGVESHTNFQPEQDFDMNVAMYVGNIVREFQALSGTQTGTAAMPAPVVK